ncbi:MAG: putative cysteine desulfurase 2 [Candidatus Bathyarchaeota archaeon BA1]|nr:MAG: putative cysteine desulfurase 2 [Candidatus Bathyarchaeota archaeon BA1]
MFNVEKVRKDFPILETGIIYLDSTASSLTPEPVLQRMLEFYRQYRANVERGIHRLSQRASEEYERARTKVADFINAKSKSEIIMTRNTTEGINTIANGLNWKRRDRIVTSLIEHHSNFIVWLRAKKRYGVDLEIVEPTKPIVHGILDPADFEKVVDDRTKLVAVTHVSNVLGVITPVREITEIAHEHGAQVLIDAAQSVPHMKVDVQRIGCDFLAFSVTGDTPLLVFSDEGVEIVPIQRITERIRDGERMHVLTLDGLGKVVFKPITGYLTHTDKVYEVRYEGCAVPLGATGYHSVFVWKEGEIVPKRVEELRTNDYMITFNTKLELPPKLKVVLTYKHRGNITTEETKVTKNLMRLMGYYLAEGSLDMNYGVKFTFNTNEKDYIRDCKDIIKTLRGTTFYREAFERVQKVKDRSLSEISRVTGLDRETIRKYLGRSKRCSGVFEPKVKKIRAYTHTHKTASRIDISFHSKKWFEFFRQLCGTKEDKHLPGLIWHLPRSYVLELVRGYLRGNGAKTDKYNIRVKSVAKRVILELCWLLKLNGISCTIGIGSKRGDSKENYNIVIQRSELGELKEFYRERKKNGAPKDKLLPADGLRRVYAQIKPKFNYEIYSLIRNGKKRLIREGVARAIKWIENAHRVPLNRQHVRILENYKKILSGDVGTVKVKSAKEIGEVEVYDISVDNYERFFGGFYPILLHNSGHKMCAPTGSGALYVREELMEEVEPLCIGGGTIADVGLDYYKLERGPMRFEAGTPAIAEAIGLGAAIDYLRKIGMENIENHERELTKQMYEGLGGIPKVEVYGPEPKHRVGIMPFNVGNLNPHDVALALDVSASIMVRSGHHCALPLTKSLIRRPGSIRASTYFYNTKEEIEKLTTTVREIAETLAV